MGAEPREPDRTHDWFVPLGDAGDQALTVHAFPQAGGGFTAFGPLAAYLAPAIAVRALNLPGREARFLQTPRTDLGPLVDELADAVAGGGATVLFGHCSGSLLAYLVARRLRERHETGLLALVVAAYLAPDRVVPPRDLHHRDGDSFWREILSYGGVPAALAAEPDFRYVFDSAMRGDYALLAGYEYVPGPPLDVPITVLYGADDPVVGAADAERWKAHTTARCRVVPVPGDHWLLGQEPAMVADAIRAAAGRG